MLRALLLLPALRHRILARRARDEPELLDEIARDLRAARERDRARSTSGPSAAAACRSVWCGACGASGTAASALLDAGWAAAADAAAAEGAALGYDAAAQVGWLGDTEAARKVSTSKGNIARRMQQ